MKEWKEIVDELKECGVNIPKKIRPRVNLTRTGWNKPYADGMQIHPHEETIKFGSIL